MTLKEVALGLMFCIICLTYGGNTAAGYALTDYWDQSDQPTSTPDWMNLLNNVLNAANQKTSSRSTFDWSGAQADNDWSTTAERAELWAVTMEMTQKCFRDYKPAQSEYNGRYRLMEMWCDFVKGICAARDSKRVNKRVEVEQQDKRRIEYDPQCEGCPTNDDVQYLLCCSRRKRSGGHNPQEKRIGPELPRCVRLNPDCHGKTGVEYIDCCDGTKNEKRTEMGHKKQTLEEPNACDHACPRNNAYEYYVCCVKVLAERRKDEEIIEEIREKKRETNPKCYEDFKKCGEVRGWKHNTCCSRLKNCHWRTYKNEKKCEGRWKRREMKEGIIAKRPGQTLTTCEVECRQHTDDTEYLICCQKVHANKTEMEEIWNKKQTLEEPNACDHACPRNNAYEYYVCCVKVLTERRNDEEIREELREKKKKTNPMCNKDFKCGELRGKDRNLCCSYLKMCDFERYMNEKNCGGRWKRRELKEGIIAKRPGQALTTCEVECRQHTDESEYYECCQKVHANKRGISQEGVVDETRGKQLKPEQPNACSYICPNDDLYAYYMCCAGVLAQKRASNEEIAEIRDKRVREKEEKRGTNPNCYKDFKKCVELTPFKQNLCCSNLKSCHWDTWYDEENCRGKWKRREMKESIIVKRPGQTLTTCEVECRQHTDESEYYECCQKVHANKQGISQEGVVDETRGKRLKPEQPNACSYICPNDDLYAYHVCCAGVLAQKRAANEEIEEIRDKRVRAAKSNVCASVKCPHYNPLVYDTCCRDIRGKRSALKEETTIKRATNELDQCALHCNTDDPVEYLKCCQVRGKRLNLGTTQKRFKQPRPAVCELRCPKDPYLYSVCCKHLLTKRSGEREVEKWDKRVEEKRNPCDPKCMNINPYLYRMCCASRGGRRVSLEMEERAKRNGQRPNICDVHCDSKNEVQYLLCCMNKRKG